MKTYITPQEANRRFGYHTKTLGRWARDGKIDFIISPGGHYRYSVEGLEQLTTSDDTREIVLYARVSTNTQKDDLKTQAEYISKSYPQAKVVQEMGSGMNLKRKKFLELMERVQKRELKLIVIAHKDRLARFGFDFIEWYCNINNCSIEVLDKSFKTPHAELMEDFAAILHCFSSKLYFLRRYKTDIEQDIKKELDIIDIK